MSYQLILADPPWTYSYAKSNSGNETAGKGCANAQYNLLNNATTNTNLNNTGIATLGIVTASQLYVSGVTTSQNGFTSGIGITNPVKITVSGSILTFTVVGVGSTSLTLF